MPDNNTQNAAMPHHEPVRRARPIIRVFTLAFFLALVISAAFFYEASSRPAGDSDTETRSALHMEVTHITPDLKSIWTLLLPKTAPRE